MSISVATILSTVSTTLQDVGMVRWTQPELLGYLNDAVRDLITERPDTNPKLAAVVPTTGARQTIPDEAIAFIDVVGNTNGFQRHITRVDMNTLSATVRDWQSGIQSNTSLHFMFDPRTPRTYYLYPPSNGAGSIDMLYSVFPDPITSGTDTLALNAQWHNALTYFVLSRSYDKDAEYGGNAGLSQAYMAKYSQEIGEQLQGSAAVIPKQ